MIGQCDEGNKHTQAVLWNNLGVLLHSAGRYDEADSSYKQSLGCLQEAFGDDHPLIVQSLSNRSALYRDMEVYPEAERILQLAISRWDRTGWPAEMRTLSECSAVPQQMAWSELPEKDRLPLYGKTIRRLREAVLEEEKAGIAGPARARLQTTLNKLPPWFHNVALSDSIGTQPETPEYPTNRWNVIAPYIPADLSGKTVLDIGCNSGFFSLEMKRRGAKRVVGIDIMPHILAQARFTSHWFDLPIEVLQWDVYNVDALGSFDIVVFLGVLYHLKHPLYALEKVASACAGTLFFQSGIWGTEEFIPADDYPLSDVAILNEPGWPKMFFIEKSLNADESNWWIATTGCLKAMLRVSGFRNLKSTANPDTFVCTK